MDSSASETEMLGPVVVGTDGSANATTAVTWAAAEASVRNQPLTIVHATGTDTGAGHLSSDAVQLVLDAARSLLDDAVEQVHGKFPDLRVTTTLSRADAAESLLEAVGTNSTVVVGSRGRGGFAALLLGSVGLRVAARAKGPVIVVRSVAETASTGAVLAAVRDSGDLGTARFAARTARCRKAPLHVLSAWVFLQSVGSMVPLLDDMSGIEETAIEAASRVADPIRKEFPDLTVTEDVVSATSVARTLVEASQHANLLVMGTRRPAHAIGSGLGRVTHAVLHHAHCPVAVVPRT